MRTVRVGLVAEGPTDLIIIKSLLGAVIDDFSPKITVDFLDLQPSRSRSIAGSSEDGGWRNVHAWCERHPPSERAQDFFSGSAFEGELDGFFCDILVIHIDADICKIFRAAGDPKRLPPLPSLKIPANDPKRMLTYSTKVLEHWLDISHPDSAADRHVLAPAVEHTESWVVCTDDRYKDAEKIGDCKGLAHFIYYAALGREAPKGVKGLGRDKRSKYQTIAQYAAGKVDTIASRCSSFRNLERNFRLTVRHLVAGKLGSVQRRVEYSPDDLVDPFSYS